MKLGYGGLQILVSYGGSFMEAKSIELWLKEGDRNTSFFFHKMANSHRRKNFNKKIKIKKFGLKRKQPLGGRWRVPIRTSF